MAPLSLPTLLLILTLLFSRSTADKTFSSFNDYLSQLPSCARPCLSPLYDPVLKSCGATRASTSLSALKCLCKGGSVSYTNQFNRGEQEGKCAVKACDGNFRNEIASLTLDFVQFCLDIVGDGSGSSTSGGILTVTQISSPTSAATSHSSATSTASSSTTASTAGTSASSSRTSTATAAASTGAAQVWGPPAALMLMAGGMGSVSFMMV